MVVVTRGDVPTAHNQLHCDTALAPKIPQFNDLVLTRLLAQVSAIDFSADFDSGPGLENKITF
jgi:hypothetical protein